MIIPKRNARGAKDAGHTAGESDAMTIAPDILAGKFQIGVSPHPPAGSLSANCLWPSLFFPSRNASLRWFGRFTIPGEPIH